ncbi:MAG TPA: GreA/GreB family elongation factor [Chloroflexota bacterium]|nr:GreA/GreB family elongation factor [Chloroflexota bacterium]
MNDKTYMTESVREELEEELKTIEQVKKPRVSRLLGSIGDEIEQEDQADEDVQESMELLVRREAEIRDMLAAAEIVGKSVSNQVVSMGSTVAVDDGGTRRTYTLVGSVGEDPERGWITNESPIAAALLGKRVGDSVAIVAPDGRRVVTVAAIG